MFVTACDLNYILQTKCWIRSMQRFGNVKPSEILVIVFGTPAECLLLEKEIRAESSALNVTTAQTTLPEFAFTSESIFNPERSKLPLSIWLADYLRGWIGEQLGRYVWIDSDTIIKKDLSPLRTLAAQSKTISMAPERYSPVEPESNFTPLYFDLYPHLYGMRAPDYLDDTGRPLITNCGVIVFNRSYAADWKDTFLLTTALIQKGTPALQSLKSHWDLGQIIWNQVFWRAGGVLLDTTFNTFASQLPREATIEHYARIHKPQLLEQYILLGLHE